MRDLTEAYVSQMCSLTGKWNTFPCIAHNYVRCHFLVFRPKMGMYIEGGRWVLGRIILLNGLAVCSYSLLSNPAQRGTGYHLEQLSQQLIQRRISYLLIKTAVFRCVSMNSCWRWAISRCRRGICGVEVMSLSSDGWDNCRIRSTDGNSNTGSRND